MKFRILINGQDYEALGLAMLNGSLNNLLKPAEFKTLVLNENASIDGSIGLLTNRRVKSRDVAIQFLVRSTSPVDLVRKIDDLMTFFTNGRKDAYNKWTGVNEFYFPELERTYRLVLISCDKYSGFGEDSATMSFKFKELNPKNR